MNTFVSAILEHHSSCEVPLDRVPHVFLLGPASLYRTIWTGSPAPSAGWAASKLGLRRCYGPCCPINPINEPGWHVALTLRGLLTYGAKERLKEEEDPAITKAGKLDSA